MPDDNLDLNRLFESDAADYHLQPDDTPLDPKMLARRDAARRSKLKLLLVNPTALQTAEDYYRAAVIFQRSTLDTDRQQAVQLAQIAAKMRHESAQWLAEAVQRRRGSWLLRGSCPAMIGWFVLICIGACCGPYLFMRHWPRHIELELPEQENVFWRENTRMTRNDHHRGSKYFIWERKGFIQCHSNLETCTDEVTTALNKWLHENDWQARRDSACPYWTFIDPAVRRVVYEHGYEGDGGYACIFIWQDDVSTSPGIMITTRRRSYWTEIVDRNRLTSIS